MSESFAVEDRFVLRIVGALELKLTEAERIEIARVDTRTLDAREAFQRGWELYSRFNAQDNARAAEHFQRAVELDPDYGRAYGALALVYLRGAVFHDWDLALGESDARLYREVVPRYLTEAVRHETALAHVVRAMQHLNYRDQARPEGTNRGTDDARREAGEAIALQPSDPEAHITMAWALIAAGKPQEGLSFVGAAMRLNPAFPSHYVLFEAAAHYGLGDLKAAAEALGRGLARDPLAAELMPMAASVRAHLGERSEARRTVEAWRPGLAQDAREALAESYFFPIQWVGAHAGLNLRLIDGLRLAMLPEAVTVESLLTALETGADGERRFRVIRRIGWFGPMAAPAVPVLVAILGDAPRLERKEATIALGKIGPAAAEAVPLLEASLDEPIVGYHAREALKRIQAAVAE